MGPLRSHGARCSVIEDLTLGRYGGEPVSSLIASVARAVEQRQALLAIDEFKAQTVFGRVNFRAFGNRRWATTEIERLAGWPVAERIVFRAYCPAPAFLFACGGAEQECLGRRLRSVAVGLKIAAPVDGGRR